MLRSMEWNPGVQKALNDSYHALTLCHPNLLVFVVQCHAWKEQLIQSKAGERRPPCPLACIKMHGYELQYLFWKVQKFTTCTT